MAVSGATTEAYYIFMEKGGDITFEIDATDISKDREFENFPQIKPKLKTGFEIPPTSMIHAVELLASIRMYGSDWDNIFASVYICGGKVIFKKISDNKYQAHCSTPQKE